MHGCCLALITAGDGQVTSNGERLKQGLRDQLSGNPHVKEVRGLGLIVGVQLDQVRKPGNSSGRVQIE